MAKANNSKKKFLEWTGLSRTAVVTDTNPVNSKINLALRDDEVAEIHKLEVLIELSLDGAPTGARLDYALSMDPDIDDSPTADNTWEDLEVFHGDSFIKLPLQLIADVDEIDRDDKYKTINFSPPLLVGTNIGVSSKFTWITADGSGALRIRVYFTRRKANIAELNQILLKRR